MRGASGHKTTKPFSSAHTVNGPVVRRKFMLLSGETCIRCVRFGGSAVRGNTLSDGAGVSRRHSSPTPEVMLRIW